MATNNPANSNAKINATNANGVAYYDGTSVVTTTVGTSGQVLTSNGTGVAPTFQAASGGVNTFHTDGSNATGSGGAITIAGGSNIATSGASATVTVALASSPSVSGSLTAGTSVTATSGDITATSGNFVSTAATSSSVGQFKIGGQNFGHMYGSFNLFLGREAGNFTLTTGGGGSVYNVACGYQCLTGLTTGQWNFGIGSQCLHGVTSGTENVGIGDSALYKITTGGYNVAIGAGAGYAYTSSESSNIIIGGNQGTLGESNVLRIGNGTGTGTNQQNKAFISGIQGITVTGTAVLVSSSDQLGIAVSSRKYKDNIQDMGSASSEIFNLRPVTFTYKEKPEEGQQPGLIAEEVNEIMPQLVVMDQQNEPQSVKYHELPVMLLNEMQKMMKRIELLEQEVKSLKGVQ